MRVTLPRRWRQRRRRQWRGCRQWARCGRSQCCSPCTRRSPRSRPLLTPRQAGRSSPPAPRTSPGGRRSLQGTGSLYQTAQHSTQGQQLRRCDRKNVYWPQVDHWSRCRRTHQELVLCSWNCNQRMEHWKLYVFSTWRTLWWLCCRRWWHHQLLRTAWCSTEQIMLINANDGLTDDWDRETRNWVRQVTSV